MPGAAARGCRPRRNPLPGLRRVYSCCLFTRRPPLQTFPACAAYPVNVVLCRFRCLGIYVNFLTLFSLVLHTTSGGGSASRIHSLDRDVVVDNNGDVPYVQPTWTVAEQCRTVTCCHMKLVSLNVDLGKGARQGRWRRRLAPAES